MRGCQLYSFPSTVCKQFHLNLGVIILSIGVYEVRGVGIIGEFAIFLTNASMMLHQLEAL
jgi:hypothetical protein